MGRNQRQRKTQKWGVWALVGVVAVGALYYFVSGNTTAEETSLSPRLPSGAITGNAPDFSLTDIDGRSVSLKDFRGKVVILDFWATWCPPCKMEIPDFIALQSEFAGRDVQIIGIALDEPDKVKSFAMQNGMNYPVLLGSDEISQRYGGIDGIPTTYVIDKQGRIAARYEGYRSRAVFESAIRRLL